MSSATREILVFLEAAAKVYSKNFGFRITCLLLSPSKSPLKTAAAHTDDGYCSESRARPVSKLPLRRTALPFDRCSSK